MTVSYFLDAVGASGCDASFVIPRLLQRKSNDVVNLNPFHNFSPFQDGKLKCGDRLLAVDGQSLECVPHSAAVTMLKQTSTRVVMEVVSWMGTEL